MSTQPAAETPGWTATGQLRQAAAQLRKVKHSNGYGAGLSVDLAALLDSEADSLEEIEQETADVEAAGELIIITTTTAAAVQVARRILNR